MLKPKTLLIALLCLAFGTAQTHAQQDFKNPSLPAKTRAELLVKQLTLEEKVGLMGMESPAIPRFGIKPYDWWNEALHGVARAGQATVFPQAIGMAASFNPQLLYSVFNAVSDEARAKNTNYLKNDSHLRYQGLTFWTPNINIFRDPRWGRGQETYGEDPFLTSQMGQSVVRGLQGPKDAKFNKLHACAKHFAVHSGPEWSRHTYNAENIDPRDLWETYLPAFKDLVQKADVKEVMCAYNRYEGEPCCGSERLLQQILRNEWGYKGIVLSDCWAVSDFYKPNTHQTEPDKEHASAKAVLSGTELECGDNYGSLVEAVRQGLINESEIDKAVVKLMEARIQLGEFDDNVEWRNIPLSVVGSEAHGRLALDMAKQSIVLLQNKNNVLPLKNDIKIAVLGPNANDSVMQWGNYNGFPYATSTLLSAVKRRFPEANIVYEPACDHTSRMSIESVFGECGIDGKKGFRGNYWNNMKPETPVDVTTYYDTPFHFSTAGGTVFAAGVNLGYFTGEYETVFKPQTTAEVVFSVQTQGWFNLYINGEHVFHGGNMKSSRFYAFNAEKGKEYNIKLQYSASEGDCASLNFDFGREKPLDIMGTVSRVADADVVIFAGGISPQLEGEEMPVVIEGFRGGDRDNISLPRVQREFLEALHHMGKKVVFVNYSGSAMGMKQECQWCDAIVQAWYPGQAGGEAVAQVLMGEYNPAGRLPVTFYESVEQLPDFEDYSMKGRTYRYFNGAVSFPFGHGLSYTTFAYKSAKLDKKQVKRGESLNLALKVANTGKMNGEEVVQVYLRKVGDEEGPSHALRAFKRVEIAAGATSNLTITLAPDQLEWFDTNTNTMREISGEYELLYGGTSDMSKLKSVKFSIK